MLKMFEMFKQMQQMQQPGAPNNQSQMEAMSPAKHATSTQKMMNQIDPQEQVQVVE